MENNFKFTQPVSYRYKNKEDFDADEMVSQNYGLCTSSSGFFILYTGPDGQGRKYMGFNSIEEGNEHVEYISLHLKMKRYNDHYNRVDGFVPDTASSLVKIWGVSVDKGELKVNSGFAYLCKFGAFKTKERAEAFLKVFGSDIRKNYKLK